MKNDYGIDWRVWNPKKDSKPVENNFYLDTIGKNWSPKPKPAVQDDTEVAEKNKPTNVITGKLVNAKFIPDSKTDFNKQCKVHAEWESELDSQGKVIFALWAKYKDKEYDLKHEASTNVNKKVAEAELKLFYVDEYYDDVNKNNIKNATVEYFFKAKAKGAKEIISAKFKMPLSPMVLRKDHFDDKKAKNNEQLKKDANYIQGSAVQELQEKLMKFGFLNINETTGSYGPKTEAAVKAFQECALGKKRKQNDKHIEVEITYKGKSDGVTEEETQKELDLWREKGYIAPDIEFIAKITYSGNQLKINSTSEKILLDILKNAKISSILITSTTRTPADQARIMFSNIENYGVDSQKELYSSNGDQVIDVYSNLKKDGKNDTEIINAMEQKIIDIGPQKVSAHCADTTKKCVIDVTPSSIPAEKKPDFIKSVEENKSVSKFFKPPEDPAYHIELDLHKDIT